MSVLTYTLPNIGDPNATTDPLIRSALSGITAWANGSIDGSNLTSTAAALLGLNGGASTYSGSSIIATTEVRSNVAYGTLTTADQVSNIVLPSTGLIVVWYQATWQESISGAARAAIFVGANQLRVAHAESAGPVASSATQAAATATGASATDRVLAAASFGLASYSVTAAYGGDVATGQVIGQTTNASTGIGTELGGVVSNHLPAGAYPSFVHTSGPCYIFAAAGTYTVSVQFKASSGSVTAKNRRLYVRAMGF